jgi:hypothetical protein
MCSKDVLLMLNKVAHHTTSETFSTMNPRRGNDTMICSPNQTENRILCLRSISQKPTCLRKWGCLIFSDNKQNTNNLHQEICRLCMEKIAKLAGDTHLTLIFRVTFYASEHHKNVSISHIHFYI